MQQQPWQPHTAPTPPRKRITGLKITGIALATIAIGALSACGGAPTTTPTTPAAAPATAPASKAPASKPAKAAKKAGPNVGSELRDLDMADGVAVESLAAYERAFATLSSKVQEQGVPLGNAVGAVLKLLRDKGVNDENRLTVMQHLAQSIPGPQKMGVADIGAAYVTLRTGG